MNFVYRYLFSSLWLGWGLYWWALSRNVKPVARTESMYSRLSHIVPLAIAAILIGLPRIPLSALGDRMLPLAAWPFWVGAVLTAAGLLFSVWARVHIGTNWSGIVTVKAAQPGEMVSPNSAGGGYTRTGIGTIVDMASLEAEVDVSENFINRISEGQGVTIKLNAYPEWEIPGHVITVIPTADRAKATVKVRVALDSHDSRILPDMGARVSFLRKVAGTASTNTN